jgi:hypothetical protein
LLLIVDGLDEYDLTQPSIEDWLPRPGRLPINAAVLVTSRQGSPQGIPDGHPLHRHIHRLEPSSVADKIRALAQAEIDHVVKDPTAGL